VDVITEVRWAISPHDAQCHALDIRQADEAATKGWADAECGLTLPAPAGLEVTEAPSGPLCMRCVAEVAINLPDPGPGGPPM
jgi:hypothetical protein